MDIYNIETLASLSGLSRRTIHYYVQRGLLEPPEGGGRGSFYTDSHLRSLKRIQELASQGVPLFHMKALLRGDGAAVLAEEFPGVQVSSVQKAELARGVELLCAPGALSLAEVRLVAAFVRGLIERRIDDADKS